MMTWRATLQDTYQNTRGGGPGCATKAGGGCRLAPPGARTCAPFEEDMGASNGRVAVSALGTGRACPTAVIAFCQAVARRTHSSSCDRLFSPLSCCRYTHGRFGLYRVMRTFRSKVMGGGGCWHKASVSDCLPLVAPMGLSPLLILTLCGPERVLVVSWGGGGRWLPLAEPRMVSVCCHARAVVT